MELEFAARSHGRGTQLRVGQSWAGLWGLVAAEPGGSQEHSPVPVTGDT